MKTELTLNQFNNFPIHDAKLLGITVSRSREDFLVVKFDFQVTDNSYDPGYKYAKENGTTCIWFLDCTLLKMDIKGEWRGEDTVDKCALKHLPEKLVQLDFTFHSGSRISILPKKILLFE